MIRADEKVRAVAADDEAARLLEVGVGAPLLSVERLSYTYGDRPVELRRGLYHTAAHHYRNQLNCTVARADPTGPCKTAALQ